MEATDPSTNKNSMNQNNDTQGKRPDQTKGYWIQIIIGLAGLVTILTAAALFG